MASGITNVGKRYILEIAFRDQMNGSDTLVDNLRVALITDDNVPNADDTLWSDLSGTEIPNGNGYTTGGQAISRGTTWFDDLISIADADTNDYGYVRLKNVEWTANTGPIPASGEGAAYAVLVDKKSGTDIDGNNQVLAWWDLGGQQTVADGQKLSLQDMEIRLT